MKMAENDVGGRLVELLHPEGTSRDATRVTFSRDFSRFIQTLAVWRHQGAVAPAHMEPNHQISPVPTSEVIPIPVD